MSPRWEQTGERDLAVNDWHRLVLGDDADAMDVDLVGMCRICPKPLYMIEGSRAARKPCPWLKAICNELDIPAFRILYTETAPGTRIFSRFQVNQLAPIGSEKTMDEQGLIEEINLIRAQHLDECHGGSA
jgi:hypothetical protein